MGEKLDNAKQAIEQELGSVRVKNQQLVVDAYQEGFKQGSEQAQSLKSKLAKLKELYTSEIPQDLLRNAVVAAQEMIQAELDSSTSSLLKFVQAALNTVPEAQDVRIRVNPAAASLLRENKAAFINLLQRAKDIDIREDKQVSKGIILQTESGVIDAQLKTQIEEISRVLGL